MKKNQGCFGSIVLILGAVIGAGLASGQEVVVFFARYGFISILFAFLFFILFAYGLFQILKYGKFKQKCPDFQKKYPKSFIFESCEGVIFLIFSATMVAGAESLLNEFVYDLPFKIWSILILVLALAVSSKGLNRIIGTNKILVPLIILSTITISCLSFFFSPHSDFTFSFDVSNFAFLGVSSILYATCNLMVVNKVTTELGEKIDEKKIKKVAIVSSFLLFVIISLVITALLLNDNSILFSSLPMINLAFMIGNGVGYLYSAIILFCIFTTLTSTLYSFTECVRSKVKSKGLSSAISALMIFVLSLFGFDSIVRYSYPLIGALGVVLLFTIKNRMTCEECACGKNICSLK